MPILQSWVAAFIYIAYHSYLYIKQGYNHEMRSVWIATVAMNFVILVHYLLGRKYVHLALQFSNVQLVVLLSCGF